MKVVQPQKVAGCLLTTTQDQRDAEKQKDG
jgi:hypothetical protein